MGLDWDRLGPGRAAFNRGAYFEAHELWEAVWHQLQGGDRRIVQGLIQIAAGLHHLRQRRPAPAVALVRKGLQKLSSAAETSPLAPPLDAFTRELTRLLAQLEAPGAPLPDLIVPTL